MKVYATRMLPQAGVDMLTAAGIPLTQFEGRQALNQDELIEICKHYDAVICAGQKLGAAFFEACPHLKCVALLSVGYDNVDLQAASHLNIPVTNTPGVLDASTAETAFLLMMATARKAFFMHQYILDGHWGFTDPTANLGIDLEGKTVGIFGLGNIGTVFAKYCKNFYQSPIIYHNRNRNIAAENLLDARYVSFEELLRESDVLSVHANLSASTRGIFNKDTFIKMKSSSIFINAARGGIHDENDLYEAIVEGQIWGAGLDVTNPEPMLPNNPLLRLPTVSILPHIGSATEGTRAAMAILAAKNIIAARDGKPLPNLVNKDALS